ncbi:NUDIX hydrolase [Roseivirga sp.]|uniref:NUDIX hydrolase n=1 Tax=Roseivirga sp. TaxID=1964215 RepID=UPI003B8B50C2
MRIYIKDTPLRIKRPDQIKDKTFFDEVIQEEDLLINERKFRGNMLIRNADRNAIKSILFILHNKKIKGLESVTVVTAYYDETIEYIKSKFKIIKAGGGVVYRDGEVLMIHRLGKWDLPKGKIEGDESFKQGAKREVEEECNVSVSVLDKVCTTWHTYTKGQKSILKKTVWYQMECLDDSKMKPQLDEGIDEVRWMNKKEIDVAKYNAFQSIQHVYDKFLKKLVLHKS